MLLDWRHFYRWSVVGFCTGAISGLVAITPAAGFVGVPAAALIGVVAAAVSNWLTRLKIWFNFDDTRKFPAGCIPIEQELTGSLSQTGFQSISSLATEFPVSSAS